MVIKYVSIMWFFPPMLLFFLFLFPTHDIEGQTKPVHELESVFIDLKNYIKEIAPSGSPLSVFFTNKDYKNRGQQLLDRFTQTPLTTYEQFTHNERLAFWINFHNLYVIKMISDHFPIKSTRYYSRPLTKLFELPHVEVFGKRRTINEIRNEILKKEFKNPRIPFALYIGAIDGPKLIYFPPDNDLESSLDQAAATYFKNNVTDDKDKGFLILPTSIEEWLKEWGPLPEQFMNPKILSREGSSHEKMILSFLFYYRRSMKPSLNSMMTEKPKIKIRFKRFNWSVES